MTSNWYRDMTKNSMSRDNEHLILGRFIKQELKSKEWEKADNENKQNNGASYLILGFVNSQNK